MRGGLSLRGISYGSVMGRNIGNVGIRSSMNVKIYYNLNSMNSNNNVCNNGMIYLSCYNFAGSDPKRKKKSRTWGFGRKKDKKPRSQRNLEKRQRKERDKRAKQRKELDRANTLGYLEEQRRDAKRASSIDDDPSGGKRKSTMRRRVDDLADSTVGLAKGAKKGGSKLFDSSRGGKKDRVSADDGGTLLGPSRRLDEIDTRDTFGMDVDALRGGSDTGPSSSRADSVVDDVMDGYDRYAGVEVRMTPLMYDHFIRILSAAYVTNRHFTAKHVAKIKEEFWGFLVAEADKFGMRGKKSRGTRRREYADRALGFLVKEVSAVFAFTGTSTYINAAGDKLVSTLRKSAADYAAEDQFQAGIDAMKEDLSYPPLTALILEDYYKTDKQKLLKDYQVSVRQEGLVAPLTNPSLRLRRFPRPTMRRRYVRKVMMRV